MPVKVKDVKQIKTMEITITNVLPDGKVAEDIATIRYDENDPTNAEIALGGLTGWMKLNVLNQAIKEFINHYTAEFAEEE